MYVPLGRRILAYLMVLMIAMMALGVPDTDNAIATLESPGTTSPEPLPFDEDDGDEVLDTAMVEKTGRKRNEKSPLAGSSGAVSHVCSDRELARSATLPLRQLPYGAIYCSGGSYDSLASLCTFRN